MWTCRQEYDGGDDYCALALSVLSFPLATTPAAVLPTSVPSFALRSGGLRGDMSVLSGFTAPAVLSGRSLYRGNMGGEGEMVGCGGNLAPTSLGVAQTGFLGGVKACSAIIP